MVFDSAYKAFMFLCLFMFRNAKNMPDAVRDALKAVMEMHGSLTSDQAEDYLREMDHSRRYQAETWS